MSQGFHPSTLLSPPPRLPASTLRQRLSWWYRLAAPGEPGEDATLEVQERVRRCRLASILIVVESLVELVALQIALTAPNARLIALPMCLCVAALLVAFVCNRCGNILVAGILLVSSIEVFLLFDIMTTPGGIDVFTLPLFDVLIQADLIAVSLLVPWSGLLCAGINCLCIVLALTVGPHTPLLTHFLRTVPNDTFARPITLQVVTATIGFVLARSFRTTLRRADRAEEMNKLQRALAQQTREALTQKTRLEISIEQMLAVHTQVANGNVAARVELQALPDLWQIAGQLNTLLARYQRAHEAERELRQLHEALHRFAAALRHAKQDNQRLQFPAKTGTVLDEVLIELNN